MDSISRYIFRQAMVVMIFVTVVFSFIAWLAQSLRLVDLVVNRGLPISDFLWLAMLYMPRFFVFIVPIACAVATVYVYNRLIADRELVVLRAAGWSNLRLVRPAALLALATMLLVYFLNVYLLPVSFRQFVELKLAAKSDYSSVLLQEGAFNSLPGPLTVFIRQRSGDGRLNGILVHDGRDPDQPVTLLAESGALVETAKGTRIVLIKGNRQQVDRDSGAVLFLDFGEYIIDMDLAAGTAPTGRRKNPEEMFLWELFDPALKADSRANRYRAEGHSRIAMPFMPLAFVLTALAVLLSGDFSRRGQSKRVAMAFTLVVALQTVSITTHNLARNDPDAIALLYLIVVVPVLAGLLMLGPAARRRRRVPAQRPSAG